MNKLQTKLERLKLMLVDDGYNGSNIVYKTLIEIMAEEKNNTEKQLNLSGVSQRIELLKAFLKNADDKGNIAIETADNILLKLSSEVITFEEWKEQNCKHLESDLYSFEKRTSGYDGVFDSYGLRYIYMREIKQ
jgi:hypothetical protein